MINHRSAPQRETFPGLLACAHELADASGAQIRPQFRRRLAVTDKGGSAGFDPVTRADTAAERAIVRRIKDAYPGHGIVGEETGTAAATSRYRWVIDPIDGTRAFITGLLTWGTLIGLMDGDIALLGVMDQPITRERFWSAKSASYLRSGDAKPKRLKTRACRTLKNAVLSSTDPRLFASRRQRAVHDLLTTEAKLMRYGADCYAFAMLAAGHIDVVVEPGLKTYDILALIPIIERAGGRVTTWDGGSAVHGGDVLACGDPHLHDVLLRAFTHIPS